MTITVSPKKLPDQSPVLTRDKAVEYLTGLGYPITKNRLVRLAMIGGGPEYHRWGRRVIYEIDALLAWAKSRGGEPIAHTSQLSA